VSALERLPDWSKTIDPDHHADYSLLKPALIDLGTLADADRRSEIEAYSRKYCFPKLDLSKASGLYVLLRLAFVIPREYPRWSTKVFGGWRHPSTTQTDQPFRILWPVEINEQTYRVLIAPFRGYTGKGYDAIGEYDYFLQHFPLRSGDSIRRLVFPA